MVRDALMHKVIHPNEEPIIPFISRMRQLYDEFKVSTVLVAGSSGAFFGVSDTILQMKEYNPVNITRTAKEAAGENSTPAIPLAPLTKWTDNRIPMQNRNVTESLLSQNGPITVSPCRTGMLRKAARSKYAA